VVWVNLSSQSEVVFASMGDTDGSIYIFQVPLAEFVKVDTSHVTIAKMGMLGDNGFYP
jgi:hypothetical protein